jgi:hypothetical protein
MPMDASQPYAADAGPPGRFEATRPAAEPEGVGSLIAGLIKDLQDLVRAELKLAQTEIKEDVAAAGKGIGVVAAGALVGLVAFIFLMLALTYLLAIWLPMWVSAGLVGVVLAVAAAVALSAGRNQLKAANFVPEQTIATLKEDQAWAKQQINSVTK